MGWDVTRWARDFRLEYKLTHKWIQMQCPYCQDSGLKGGFSSSGSTMGCFRCGTHPVKQAVARMMMCSEQEAQETINIYKGSSSNYHFIKDEDIAASKVDLPGRKKMRKKHRRYLEKRGFDPDELTEKWGLRFTGPEEEYGWTWRIIFPIFYEGKLVSFQGRDVTGNEGVIRYRGSAISDSVLHYKKLLYGIEKCSNNTAVVVEGIFDLYNFGNGAVCTFGTSLTSTQIRLLAELDRVIFLFDPDDFLAWEKAKKYVLELRTLGIKAERVHYYDGGDPGSLSKDEIRYIRKYIGI